MKDNNTSVGKECNGVSSSNCVISSDGVRSSYGVLNSFGVNKAIFLANKPEQPTIFGVEVSDDRFKEVWENLHVKLNGWFPKFHNAFELYKQNGNEWKKVDASKIEPTEEGTAWKDMPQEAIDYVKSLPEFDAKMFKEITNLDVEDKCCHSGAMKYCPNCGCKL